MPKPANPAAFLAFVPVAASVDAVLAITLEMEDVITADYDYREGGLLAVIYVASETDGLGWSPLMATPTSSRKRMACATSRAKRVDHQR